MKLLIFLLLSIVPIQWETDFETAKKNAAEQHKLILLNFSGSDWCAPCILTRKDYFDTDVFSSMAKDNLIMVNADFPRKKKNALPGEIAKQNSALAEKYNPQGNFPLTLLLDPSGKIIKSWTGKPEVSVEAWANEIKSLCDEHK